MLGTALALFLAGLLTILLPCILPLLPIVLGASIADRNPLRPLVIVGGMLISFVGSIFLLQVVLSQFTDVADIVRLGSYDLLLLFGVGFLTQSRAARYAGAVIGALFFLDKGPAAVVIALVVNVIGVEVGGLIANKLQQLGTDVQSQARESFGQQSLLSGFIVGLTMGLVWAPCAGPALSFALTLVRTQPGLAAFGYLLVYGIGSAIPLLIVGYGGQRAVHSVRALSKYSGRIKQVAGALLILSAIAFRLNLLQDLQVWVATNTGYGGFGDNVEKSLFLPKDSAPQARTGEKLPVLGTAPEFAGLGTWHNSAPLTMAGLKGKVVLVDFWTYSCINCIRTLPYIEGYAEKYKNQPFTVVGIHTPEFAFEKVDANVADAIKHHSLTYPVAQDNDFGTWTAFHNQYWPAKYLIDAQGRIRYTHFGEGGYDETDAAIASLLAEIGAKADTGAVLPAMPAEHGGDMSQETYLGSRSWDAFGNAAGGPSDKAQTYAVPATLQQEKYYLGGTWKLADDEREVLQSDTGTIAMRFTGGEINLVMGLADGAAPVKGDITVDGKAMPGITIDRHDLFNLYTGAGGQHEMTLTLHGKGVEAYAFTFGG
jgi:cytochrome c biogenesis protein CcdA/thiol-disulfide isomerase/thioredoxin